MRDAETDGDHMTDDDIETDTETPEALAQLLETVSELGWCVAMPNCKEGGQATYPVQ
jgi:hypothetical protein